ncbi:flippase [Aureibacillus halotolerans]|uniref:O-antigen/teichoic acid export membrane protein n=1 Tax=Aureibacillus halotolerans TaxID=1508390 RepID=A0A4R6U0F4_9BACI|nr:flippase [Aureibacillus halotolerans]TDQ38682.1 O-antigen/teichoic acid export membrane protein [Aureibacillus halotolerans]
MKTFMKNAFMTLLRQMAGIGAGLLTTVLIARELGPSGQGAYALAILLPTLLMTFMNLGVGQSSVYYIGQKQINVADAWKTNTITAAMLSTLAIVVGVLIVLFGDAFFGALDNTLLIGMLFLLPVLFASRFFQALFQAVKDFASFNIIVLTTHLSLLASVWLALSVFHLGLPGALIAYAVAQIVTLGVVAWLLRSRLQLTWKKATWRPGYMKSSIAFGSKAYMSNVMAFLNYRVDLLLVSFYLSPAAVGIYFVTVSFAEKLWMVSQAITTVLYPEIASSKSESEKNRLTSTVARMTCGLSLAMGVVLWVISEPAVHLVLGAEYAQAAVVLKWLLPGIVLGAVAKIFSNDVAGRGKPEYNLYVSIAMVVCNILLNIAFIPWLGIKGAALATSVTYGINWLIKCLIFRRMTHMPWLTFLCVQPKDIEALWHFVARRRRTAV